MNPAAACLASAHRFWVCMSGRLRPTRFVAQVDDSKTMTPFAPVAMPLVMAVATGHLIPILLGHWDRSTKASPSWEQTLRKGGAVPVISKRGFSFYSHSCRYDLVIYGGYYHIP